MIHGSSASKDSDEGTGREGFQMLMDLHNEMRQESLQNVLGVKEHRYIWYQLDTGLCAKSEAYPTMLQTLTSDNAPSTATQATLIQNMNAVVEFHAAVM